MRRARNGGFTLIELLLSLAIFTIIGVAVVRNLQQIQNTKNLAFQDIDLYNDARAAISSLRTDLSQAFHVLYDDLGEENKNLLMQNQPVPHTLFDGRKNELIFTSLSHRVYYVDRRETDQTEISYFLQKRQGSKLPSLMKRESEMVDADLYQGGSVYTLIDNVVTFELEYWDEKTSKWVSDWSSDGGAYRDMFPRAVKVRLELAKNDTQRLKIETQFKVAFPNNDGILVQF